IMKKRILVMIMSLALFFSLLIPVSACEIQDENNQEVAQDTEIQTIPEIVSIEDQNNQICTDEDTSEECSENRKEEQKADDETEDVLNESNEKNIQDNSCILPDIVKTQNTSKQIILDSWGETETIDTIDSYDGVHLYYYRAAVSLSVGKDDGGKNIYFRVRELTLNDEDPIIEEVRLADGYTGWIAVGSKELETGKSYYVEIEAYNSNWINESYIYDIAYEIGMYDGYAESISMTSQLSLKCGQNRTLKVNFFPSNTYSILDWKSSNRSIATVDPDGTIHAKKAGTCNIIATTQDGYTAACTVKITNPAPYLNYKSKTIHRGSKFTLKLMYPVGKVTYKSTNKKIATVSSKGVVKGKSIGTCTIKVKCKGKTYNCKIKVAYAEPNFGAVLYDYNTRSNKFIVKIKNWGSKTLYIKKGTGKVEDVDYKSYDRKVSLSKTIRIKPHSSKTLSFKVKGRITWYDVSDFTLFYRFTYDGKTYTWHVWDENSVLKKGKGWYTTYWDEEQYWNAFW
ncbi:MAG: Ig-like domain-containing protein, partial [Lachnospiraceae bacterium]